MHKTSLVNLEHAARQLPARQRWDRRYAALHPVSRREPTVFVVCCLPHLPTRGCALDIAAGAGRHTLALARRGLQVDAVDISWQGLQLARQRAIEDGISAKIQFIVADVERAWLPHRQYNVILVSYFLHRPLIPLIKERLRPGGWLVYETFTVGQLQKSYHQRPSRREMYLEPDELRATFSSGIEAMFYDEGDHNGRVTAQLLAQKARA